MRQRRARLRQSARFAERAWGGWAYGALRYAAEDVCSSRKTLPVGGHSGIRISRQYTCERRQRLLRRIVQKQERNSGCRAMVKAEHSTQALATLNKLGDRAGSRITWMPSRISTLRKVSKYFVSRSRIRYRVPRRKPSCTSMRLRAINSARRLSRSWSQRVRPLLARDSAFQPNMSRRVAIDLCDNIFEPVIRTYASLRPQHILRRELVLAIETARRQERRPVWMTGAVLAAMNDIGVESFRRPVDASQDIVA
jgi:hypothetical protein